MHIEVGEGAGEGGSDRLPDDHWAWHRAQSPEIMDQDLSWSQESAAQMTEPPRLPLLLFYKFVTSYYFLEPTYWKLISQNVFIFIFKIFSNSVKASF